MTSVLDELQSTIAGVGGAVGPSRGRPRARLGPRLGRRDRPRPGAHQRPQPARRRGRRCVRRDGERVPGPVSADRPRPRPRRARPRHRRRAAGRVARRRRGPRAGHPGGRPGRPRRARPAGHAGLRHRRRPRASAVPAGGASRAPSSTAPLCPAAPPAARWWTPRGALLGVNSIRLEGGLILAVPATPAIRDRLLGLAGGEPPRPPRLGVAVAPPGWPDACAARSACPSAPGCWCAASRTDSPADRAGHPEGRPAGRGGRPRARRHRRPVRRSRRPRRPGSPDPHRGPGDRGPRGRGGVRRPRDRGGRGRGPGRLLASGRDRGRAGHALGGQPARDAAQRGPGSSAVALTPDGFMLTSAHVVGRATRGRATFSDGGDRRFEVVGPRPALRPGRAARRGRRPRTRPSWATPPT